MKQLEKSILIELWKSFMQEEEEIQSGPEEKKKNNCFLSFFNFLFFLDLHFP